MNETDQRGRETGCEREEVRILGFALPARELMTPPGLRMLTRSDAARAGARETTHVVVLNPSARRSAANTKFSPSRLPASL